MHITELRDGICELADRMKTDRFYDSMMECFDEEQDGFMYEATLRVFRDKDGLFKATLAMNKKIQAGHLGFFQGLEG
jgi:hypothetical protein